MNPWLDEGSVKLVGHSQWRQPDFSGLGQAPRKPERQGLSGETVWAPPTNRKRRDGGPEGSALVLFRVTRTQDRNGESLLPKSSCFVPVAEGSP